MKARLRAEDRGKFLAIDVESGDYELDGDDYTAVSRLHTRRRQGDIWLNQAFEDATFLIARQA